MTVPPAKKNTPTDTRPAGGAPTVQGGLDRHLPGLRARLQQYADEVDAAARRQIAEQDASGTGNTARLC